MDPLPLVGEDGCWENKNVKKFQELASQCDALVSSPEYHGTTSGAMKNTFDWFYSKHVSGKVFGLMSTLGGVAPNTQTMRIMLRWLHAWPVPEQLQVKLSMLDEDGNLVDPDIVERLEKLVNSVIETSKNCHNGGYLMSRPSFSDEFGGNYLLIEPDEFLMGDSVGDGLIREPLFTKGNHQTFLYW